MGRSTTPPAVSASLLIAINRPPIGTTPQIDTRAGRRYRRTKHRHGPRLYRTREDPFATVWQEIEQELTARPDWMAKALFADLQHHHPGQFPANQLRTLQRRMKGGVFELSWRSTTAGLEKKSS